MKRAAGVAGEVSKRSKPDDDDDDAAADAPFELEKEFSSFQQRIGEYKDKLEQLQQVEPSGLEDLVMTNIKELQATKNKNSFLTKFRSAVSAPLKEEVATLCATVIFDDLGVDQDLPDKEKDEIIDCIVDMLSNTAFFIKLFFKAFYNESFLRLCFGVSCNFFEIKIAYQTLTLLINTINTGVYVITLTGVKNLSELFGLFQTAYTLLDGENIMKFLTLIYGADNAAKVYQSINTFTADQRKLVLEGLYIHTVNSVGRNAPAAAPGGAAAAPGDAVFGPPPQPLSLMARLLDSCKRNAGKSLRNAFRLHAIIGPEDERVTTKITEKVGVYVNQFYAFITEQLNATRPDPKNDIKVQIYQSLWGIDAFTKPDEFRIKLNEFYHDLMSRLYEKKKAELSNDRRAFMTWVETHIPTLLMNSGGLTEHNLQEIYGDIQFQTSDTQLAVCGDSMDQNTNAPCYQTDILLQQTEKSSTLVGFLKFMAGETMKFYSAIGGLCSIEQVAAPPPPTMPSEHAVMTVQRHIQDMKDKIDQMGPGVNDEIKTGYKQRIEKVLSCSIRYIQPVAGGVTLVDPTTFKDSDEDLTSVISECYTFLKKSKDGFGVFFEKSVLETDRYIQNLCHLGVSVQEELMGMYPCPPMAGPMGGQSEGAVADYLTKIEEIDKFNTDLVEISQVQAAEALRMLSDGQDDGMDSGGSKSRRSSRKNAKKTVRRARKGRATKQSKKTQQRRLRRSTHNRRSSRKNRK